VKLNTRYITEEEHDIKSSCHKITIDLEEEDEDLDEDDVSLPGNKRKNGGDGGMTYNGKK
jgi:hypothetical protein